MKYSVITPSYNQAAFLERTIKSVISQNYPNLEYIIIDGGSTDGSVDLIKKYEDKISYWISEKDKGQSHAFNKGLERATGEIIGWINSDDIYYPNAIKECAKIFENRPDADAIFSNYNFIDENDNVLKTRKEIPYDYKIYLWSKGCYHANCAGFFRRKCFENFGGLREDLQYAMDYEFYLRLGQNKCIIIHSNDVWGAYRFHDKSKSVSATLIDKKHVNYIFYKYARQVIDNGCIIFLTTGFYKIKRIMKKFVNGCYF
jgi:glycosyltransferase involved in cell wall biosynthesis